MQPLLLVLLLLPQQLQHQQQQQQQQQQLLLLLMMLLLRLPRSRNRNGDRRPSNLVVYERADGVSVLPTVECEEC